ncbi:hypothetical protein [Rheinheimera sp.]|uniref:hypothetical protein n=1 Tax=Rheinheimera sp. TaxID=1869214 RepID=UPI0027B9DDB4|nr:hypothetical protein [Rheinheimera sp.]
MIQKEYYQLDELNSRFQLTNADIKYFFDKSKLVPVFNLPLKSYVVGTFAQSRFVGYGACHYKGLVSILNQNFLELWDNSKTEVERVILRDMSVIQNYTENSPFQAVLPTNSIYAWEQKAQPALRGDCCMAIFLPEEIQSASHFFSGRFAELATSTHLSEPVRNLAQQTAEKCKTAPAISHKKITQIFKLTDVCVLHSDLVRLGVIKETSNRVIVTNATQQEKPSISNTAKFANPFHKLIGQILSEHKNIKTKGVIRILSEEVKKQEDSRDYDHENILLDDVDGVFIWRDFSARKTERHCSINSIRNVIRDVKVAMQGN